MTERMSQQAEISEVGEFARLQLIAGDRRHAPEVAHLLAQARDQLNGQWRPLLRQIRPDLARPEVWAQRLIRRFAAGGVTSALPARAVAHPARQENLPDTSPPGARRQGDPAPQPLDERSARIYARLRPLLDLPRDARAAAVMAAAADLGASAPSVYRWLGIIRSQGAAALGRRRRRDAGRPRLSQRAQQALLARRLDPQVRQPISVTIAHVQRLLPDERISTYSARRLLANIPRSMRMGPNEWRANFEATGRWEVPHPNHTQVFDMTDGDLFVWDRDSERPYRPKLTALVDEHTQCCLGAIYTREPPSRATLQAVLLHGWLPKDGLQAPYGIPLHLHCDNGKIQTSGWLRAVCAELHAEYHDREGQPLIAVQPRHAQKFSPWQDGHIEQFFGIVHTHFESDISPAAYCGRNPQERREGFRGSEGRPVDWEGYPTLDALNYAFGVWIATAYHAMRHGRLKMTRAQAWAKHALGHVRTVDKDLLYHHLLWRERRCVARGLIRVDNMFYLAPILQSYEGQELEVRWDPMDLSRLLVLRPDGSVLCWAERQPVRNVDNPADHIEQRQQRRQIRHMKTVLQEAVGIAPLLDRPEFDAHVAAMAEERRRADQGMILFPPPAERIEPAPTEAQMEPEELLSTEQPPEPERALMYGLEI